MKFRSTYKGGVKGLSGRDLGLAKGGTVDGR